MRQKYRAELPQMERDKLVAEWGRLVGKEDKTAQVAQFSKVGAGRGNKGGESEVARQLGLDRDDVRRAFKVVQRMHSLWGSHPM